MGGIIEFGTAVFYSGSFERYNRAGSEFSQCHSNISRRKPWV